MKSLNQLDPAPAMIVADKYLLGNLQPIHKQYIDNRIGGYTRTLEKIISGNITAPFSRALVLWDEKLFFEVHEILEHEWLNSEGAAKLIFQAMIRAAGMYIQLARGNIKGATSMAAKAVETFDNNRSEVPDILNIDLLLSKLRNVDPIPPKLFKNIS